MWGGRGDQNFDWKVGRRDNKWTEGLEKIRKLKVLRSLWTPNLARNLNFVVYKCNFKWKLTTFINILFYSVKILTPRCICCLGLIKLENPIQFTGSQHYQDIWNAKRYNSMIMMLPILKAVISSIGNEAIFWHNVEMGTSTKVALNETT